MEYILIFIITFIICFITSFFVVIRKTIKNDFSKLPVELFYIVNKYKIDLNKINKKRLLYLISLVTSFDISITVIIVEPLKNIYIEIISGFILLIPLIIITFNYLGNYFIKKGMN